MGMGRLKGPANVYFGHARSTFHKYSRFLVKNTQASASEQRDTHTHTHEKPKVFSLVLRRLFLFLLLLLLPMK